MTFVGNAKFYHREKNHNKLQDYSILTRLATHYLEMVVNPIDNIISTSVHFYILPANISKNTLTIFFKNGQIYTVYCSYEPKYCIEMGHVIYGARDLVDAHTVQH